MSEGDKLSTLTGEIQNLSVEDPTLHIGELLVRQAGKEEFGECDVPKAVTFTSLPIDESLKSAIKKKGFSTMSKIQQIGLPLFLSNPPAHLIAQAQAGTGKTATFVLGSLARMNKELLSADLKTRINKPQVIILAVTQELVTQIAVTVNEFGQDMGIHARRVMSDINKSVDGGRGRGRGRGSGALNRGNVITAEWSLAWA